jgi:two-component system nitrogen regulation response regulator GlnG
VVPVGGTQPQPLNIRILTATHQDLSRRVAEGAFRHDLYFRLNVFQVELPPLRDRIEDIPLLAEHFLARFGARSRVLQADTVKFLQGLPWLGNVRELRNALEHAAIVARGEPLRPEHFPRFNSDLSPTTPEDQIASSVRKWLAERIRAAGRDAPSELYNALLRIVESALLEDVMRRVQDNRWVAAQWLSLNRATVRKKLKEYGLTSVTGNGPEEETEE